MSEAESPFDRLKPVLRGVFGEWWRFMAFAIGSAILFGIYPPIGIVALMFTILMPILMLILWGRSLDEELGWTELDEGPW